MRAIAQPDRNRVTLGVHLDVAEHQIGAGEYGRERGVQLLLGVDLLDAWKVAGLRDAVEAHAAAGVGRLHTGLAVVLVVDHDDRQVLRGFGADGGKSAERHQHLTVAGDDHHAPRWLGERKPQSHHRGRPHTAPEIEGIWMVRSSGVIAGRAEPSDDQAVSARLEQRAHHGASIHGSWSLRGHYLLQSLKPIRRWPSSTAMGRFELNVITAAAWTTSRTDAASSTRCTMTPDCSSTRSVLCPIGSCQGLNSPHSPRIVM